KTEMGGPTGMVSWGPKRVLSPIAAGPFSGRPPSSGAASKGAGPGGRPSPRQIPYPPTPPPSGAKGPRTTPGDPPKKQEQTSSGQMSWGQASNGHAPPRDEQTSVFPTPGTHAASNGHSPAREEASEPPEGDFFAGIGGEPPSNGHALPADQPAPGGHALPEA